MQFCQYCDNEIYFVQDIRKVSNFPPRLTCPWPKGIYRIDGYSVNVNKIPPVVSSG